MRRRPANAITNKISPTAAMKGKPCVKPAAKIMTSLTKRPKGGRPRSASIAARKPPPVNGMGPIRPLTAEISVEP